MEFEIKKVSEVKFEIARDKSKGMNTGISIYTTDSMLDATKKDRTLQQAVNATTLPGIIGNVLLMPDMHEGYGFPVGGVAAFDANNGIISPGAVGYDINCGVRLVKTNLTEKELRPKLKQLMDRLFTNVPSGVGSKLKLSFSKEDLARIAVDGVPYIIEKGFGFNEDIDATEENGHMLGADFSKVSSMAKSRGIDQLGTLGAGNHFLEVQKVDKVFDEGVARAYGLEKDQIVIMVHTGSRGFEYEGKKVKVYVHRKGATRAFSKGRNEIPKKYREVGQPVIIPGSMGTASYILAGLEGAMKETFGSTCHGSGRVMSRHQAIREISASDTFSSLAARGIEVRVKTRKLISEEAEGAYKNVDNVVGVVERAGISRIVVRNVPLGVAKG